MSGLVAVKDPAAWLGSEIDYRREGLRMLL